MELVDYTGNLNNHNEYLQIIDKLENKCKYIEYVLVDKDDRKFIEKFDNLIISLKEKNEWCGTKSGGKSKVYKIKSSSEIFKCLKKIDTFCKYYVSNHGDVVEKTDFGINDIAFFDDNKMPLLFTITHEGCIIIRNDLLKK